jgi:hypothetical protein
VYPEEGDCGGGLYTTSICATNTNQSAVLLVLFRKEKQNEVPRKEETPHPPIYPVTPPTKQPTPNPSTTLAFFITGLPNISKTTIVTKLKNPSPIYSGDPHVRACGALIVGHFA